MEKDKYDILNVHALQNRLVRVRVWVWGEEENLPPTWRAAPGRRRNSLENRFRRKLKVLKISSETTAQLKDASSNTPWRGSSGANSRF